MRLNTTSLLACAFQALLSGVVLADGPPEVKDIAPGTPIRSEGCDLQDAKLFAEPGGPSKRMKLGDRYLRITLPKRYDPKVPAPLVLAYHGVNSTSADFEKLTLLSHAGYNNDMVVVYPEASEGVRSPSLFHSLLTHTLRANGCPPLHHRKASTTLPSPTPSSRVSPRACASTLHASTPLD
jgi:hypothetical protein